MAAKKGFTQHCEKCNSDIGTYGFKKHYAVCDGTIINRYTPNPYVSRSLICQYCNKLCKNFASSSMHQIRCIHNENRIPPTRGMLGKKGSNHYTTGCVTTCPQATRDKLKISCAGIKWTDKQKLAQSVKMKEVAIENPESYSSSNRGRTKQIIYDDVKFQGNWELDFYKWAKSKNYNIIRPVQGFKYTYDGQRTYFPDFYILELDSYIEVKGYETDKDRAKWRDFPYTLIVIKEEQIKQIRKDTFNMDVYLNRLEDSPYK